MAINNVGDNLSDSSEPKQMRAKSQSSISDFEVEEVAGWDYLNVKWKIRKRSSCSFSFYRSILITLQNNSHTKNSKLKTTNLDVNKLFRLSDFLRIRIALLVEHSKKSDWESPLDSTANSCQLCRNCSYCTIEKVSKMARTKFGELIQLITIKPQLNFNFDTNFWIVCTRLADGASQQNNSNSERNLRTFCRALQSR